MVPISLALAEQNPPISFAFSWLWAKRRRKMAVCEGKYLLLIFFFVAAGGSDKSLRHFEVKNTRVDCTTKIAQNYSVRKTKLGL